MSQEKNTEIKLVAETMVTPVEWQKALEEVTQYIDESEFDTTKAKRMASMFRLKPYRADSPKRARIVERIKVCAKCPFSQPELNTHKGKTADGKKTLIIQRHRCNKCNCKTFNLHHRIEQVEDNDDFACPLNLWNMDF